MTPVAVAILDRAGEQLGGFLPRLGGALVLLVVGILLARLIGRLVRKALQAAGIDDLAERGRVHVALERAGLGRSLATVLGQAVRWGLIAIVVFAAVSLLGLQFLSASLNEGVLFLPKLLVAAALLLAGVVLGGFTRERVDRLTAQMDLPVPLGQVAQAVVIAVFAVSAAIQVSISAVVLVGALGILLAAAAATVALAFGLGGRDAARAVSAGRYVRDALEVGQFISVGGVQGRIAAIEPTATVLEPGDGSVVRVPNRMLLDSVVVVHDEGPVGAA